jgi:hypothetical protein
MGEIMRKYRLHAAGIALLAALASCACSGGSAGLELAGHDLGVTEVGASFDTALAKITDVLGTPSTDPAPGHSCPGSTREVAWPELRIGERDGLLIGWVSTSGELATDKGIRVGSTQADLMRSYGDSLALVPATAGVGTSFAVDGTSLAGNIGPSGVVSALFSGACGV